MWWFQIHCTLYTILIFTKLYTSIKSRYRFMGYHDLKKFLEYCDIINICWTRWLMYLLLSLSMETMKRDKNLYHKDYCWQIFILNYFVNPGELISTKIDKSTVHTHQVHFLGKIWKSNARMITLSLIDLKKNKLCSRERTQFPLTCCGQSLSAVLRDNETVRCRSGRDASAWACPCWSVHLHLSVS